MILLLVLIIAFLYTMFSSNERKDSYSYSDFVRDTDKMARVEVIPNSEHYTGEVLVIFKDSTKHQFPVLDTRIVKEDLRGKIASDKDFKFVENEPPKTSLFISLIPSVVILISVILLLFFIISQAQGGGGKAMSFGKSRAKMVVDKDKKVNFSKVAGLEEEKEELAEVVEFLKDPKKFVNVGARIPKGVLLVGPPGTGKTLLARAVAGEAGVPFFSISGSDFVEMFVGVGASRVRDLFENAKKNSPSIVFIDEIDAVGRKRGAGLGGGHDEREQTLNQLLVEMDGFGVNEGVIIIAATNRADILDPALLRPGRFDRKVVVGRPDVKGREEILKVHSKGKPLSDDVDLREVAATTVGFTGADLANLLNEAAIYAARSNKKVINQYDLRKAFIKIGIGTEKKSRIISEKEKKITAYHESGHAILFELLSELDPVHSISIIPTGMAGGYTMPLPSKDPMYRSKKYMEQDIVCLLGGRAAEKIIFDDVTTGASNDIERASAIARNMVVKYGMSDLLGPIQFGSDNDEVFIGRDWGHTRNYGDEIAGLIDSEIKRIVDESYRKALTMLEENIDILHKTSELLIEHEKISGSQFKALFKAKEEGILDSFELKDIPADELIYGRSALEEVSMEELSADTDEEKANDSETELDVKVVSNDSDSCEDKVSLEDDSKEDKEV